MLTMLDRMRDLESRKRQEVVGTDTFAQLAWEVLEHRPHGAAVGRAPAATGQRGARRTTTAIDEHTRSNEVPARRLDVVLAEWRQAEMTQSQALPGSPEAERAAEEVARLRSEYGMLQERKAAARPELRGR